MNSIWDANLKDFLDRIASHAPTPGGGSVSAVVAAQGLALVIMALEITLRRTDDHPGAEDLLERGKATMKLLADCADDDIAAFEKYLEALRLPNSTPAEKEVRGEALEAASIVALEIPLRCAERCRDALVIAREAIAVAHQTIVSDVGAGAAMIHGALTATLYNVDINLNSITNEVERRSAIHSRRELQRRSDELAYVIHKETEAKIVG